jgi:8-oxo-dGTP pyrophosphatase MutT (NUDIX family)
VRRYSMIFCFSDDFQYILLLQKSTPPWLVGQWYGPGGKIEASESDLQGAVRELKEETNLTVEQGQLTYVLTFSCHCDNEIHEIAVYAVTLPVAQILSSKGSEDEPVSLFSVNHLPVKLVQRTRELLTLCKIRLTEIVHTWPA